MVLRRQTKKTIQAFNLKENIFNLETLLCPDRSRWKDNKVHLKNIIEIEYTCKIDFRNLNTS